MSIDVVDFGYGNTRSVVNWLNRQNVATRVVHRSADLRSESIVLPGVGSAGPYMSEMRRLGFDQRLQEHFANGNRIMGICLGFQVLTTGTEEDGGVEGLNLISGTTEKLGLGVTHNEWETLDLEYRALLSKGYRRYRRLTRKIKYSGRVFYNHEYGVRINDESSFCHVVSQNLKKFTGLAVTENLIGMQFHPEKSQKGGSDLLKFLL